MSGVHYSRHAIGKYGTNVRSLELIPSITRGACKRLVIGTHGANANPEQYRDVANLGHFRLANALADAGYLVVITDMGGPQTWCNDLVLSAFDSILTGVGSEYPDVYWDKAFLWGSSMGNGTALRIAADRPTKVTGVVGTIPLCDTNNIRTSNALGARAIIDYATGSTYPAPLPARMDILARAQAGEMAGLPWRGYNSGGDTVCPPSTVAALVAAIGSTASNVVTSSVDHGDVPVQAVNVHDFMSFVNAHAA